MTEQKKCPVVGLLLLSATAITSSYGFTVFCLFLFAYFVLREKFGNRLMSSIGTASYSIYLVHFMVISMALFISDKLGVHLPFELAFIVVMALALCIALFVTKPIIEDPFINLGKRLCKAMGGQTPLHLAETSSLQSTFVGGLNVDITPIC